MRVMPEDPRPNAMHVLDNTVAWALPHWMYEAHGGKTYEEGR